MGDYIYDFRLKWNHTNPKKHQLPPHKHTPKVYGAKIQYATDTSFSPPLDDKGTLRIQSIVGALLYYAQAFDNILLIGINELVQQQDSATKDTNADLFQLLDYVATYPNDGILYLSSGMVLTGH